VLLYDIQNDPLEEHDLSASKPELVKELTAALEVRAIHRSALVDLDPHVI
jgi:hypothetical protein